MAESKEQMNDTFIIIPIQQVIELLNNNADDMIVIDQRSNHKTGDFHGGHIKNAINIPSNLFESQLADVCKKFSDKKYIIFHCMHSQVQGPTAAQIYVKYLN